MRDCFVLLLQGGTIATKVVLDNSDMFAGMVLISPAFICCPRYLTTSSVAVSELMSELMWDGAN